MPLTRLALDLGAIHCRLADLFEREPFRTRVPSYRKNAYVSIIVSVCGGAHGLTRHKLLISTGMHPPVERFEDVDIWMWSQAEEQTFQLKHLGQVSRSGQLCFDCAEPGQQYYLAATNATEDHTTLAVPGTKQGVELARQPGGVWKVVSDFAELRGDVWLVRIHEVAASANKTCKSDDPGIAGFLERLAGICLRASDGASQTISDVLLRTLRYRLRGSMPQNLALHDLRECDSVAEVLNWLLARGRGLGLSNVRFYPLSHDIHNGYRFCSHASVGHDSRTAHRLSVGQIVKFLDKSPPENHDSFWAVILGVPIVFILDDECQRELECYVAPDSVPLVRVHENRCMNVLVRHRSDAWVDFPLFGGVMPTGKLSCDFEGPVTIRDDTSGVVAQSVADRVLQFNELVQLVAARLDVLYRQEMEGHRLLPSPEEIGREIRKECETSDSLEQFCTERIPRILNCRYGSILTLSRDTLGSELLVFRKTSFPKSRREECVSTYSLKENALTSWVARNGRSICLQDLGDPDLRRDKLREYDSDLNWANKIQDSDRYGDLLIVPVFCKGEVIAVVRYTQRENGNFTESEQRWLEEVCRHLGPKLESAWRRDSDALANKYGEQIAAISVRDSVTSVNTPREIAVQFGSVVQSIFPRSPGQKAILVNVIDEDPNQFVHHAVINDLEAATKERYELKGSLTGLVVSSPGIVFINDLERAAAQGHYRRVFHDAVCALACRIGYSHRHYGAIVVLSNRYDISDRLQGAALKLVAERVGEILYRREVSALLCEDAPRSTGLKVAIRRIGEIVCRNQPKPTENDRNEAQMLISLCEQMVDALTQVGPTDKDFAKNFRQFCVREAVQNAASLIPQDDRVELRYSIDPNLYVTAQEGFFVTILSGLLRDACNFSREITVSADRRRGATGEEWLDICVMSLGRRRPLQRSWDNHGILESLSLGRYPGITNSRSLARLYRLPDGRSGDICVNEGNPDALYRCTFQLPVATEAPTPSTC